MCVCWGCWNSIRQMDLFRVFSLLPKKGSNMFFSFANSKHQYVEHISIRLTIFHSLVYSFFLFCLFVLLPLVTAADESRTHLSPFHGHKMNRRDKTGLHCGFSRERRKRDPLARGFYSRDYSARLDSEGESRSRQPGPRRRKERTEMIHLYRGSLRVG